MTILHDIAEIAPGSALLPSQRLKVARSGGFAKLGIDADFTDGLLREIDLLDQVATEFRTRAAAANARADTLDRLRKQDRQRADDAYQQALRTLRQAQVFAFLGLVFFLVSAVFS